MLNFQIQKQFNYKLYFMHVVQKLHTLTTLRFVAATMIVFHHLDDHCGFSKMEDRTFPLASAVTFFFMLSGFILTYAYPSLESWEERKKFLISRIARIWPVHCFLLCVVCLLTFSGLIHNVGGRRAAILNLFMIHSWIPSVNNYFSFNAPSWSISTEFFFYLCFPLIIYNWSKTWLWKIIVIFLIPIILMFTCAYFQFPDYSPIYTGITNHGVLFINPLARLTEFCLGILTATIWVKYKDKIKYNYILGTIGELIVIFLVILNLLYYAEVQQLTMKIISKNIVHEFDIWTGQSSILACLSFMLLIMTFAQQRGVISKIFSFRLSVLLGEISFSIYLIHQIINRTYLENIAFFEGISNKTIFIIYWMLLLSCSYLIWRFVECPARSWILKKYSQKELIKQNRVPLNTIN